MYFDASDTPTEDIFALVLMSMAYPSLDTVRGSANDFRRRSKSTLGAIDLSISTSKRGEETRLYLLLRFSCLDSRREDALALAEEYLLGAVLENREIIRRTVIQKAALYSDVMTESGHSVAVARAAATKTPLDALKEYTGGYELYRRLKAARSFTDGELDRIIEKMRALRERIIVRERLTLALTGRSDAEYSRRCADSMPSGEPSRPSDIKPLPKGRFGIAIPSQVSYAAMAGNLYTSGAAKAYDGAWATLSSALDFELLWEEIRVKGGAYGTGFACRQNSGTAIFYSYRDPSPETTVETYRRSPDIIREWLTEDINLEQLIIGTVGALDPVSTPAADGSAATVLYLAGLSHEDVLKKRRECIATTKEKLAALADALEVIIKDSSIVVVGPREQLMRLGLDEILEI